jgi:hypothetical protein
MSARAKSRDGTHGKATGFVQETHIDAISASLFRGFQVIAIGLLSKVTCGYPWRVKPRGINRGSRSTSLKRKVGGTVRTRWTLTEPESNGSRSRPKRLILKARCQKRWTYRIRWRDLGAEIGRTHFKSILEICRVRSHFRSMRTRIMRVPLDTDGEEGQSLSNEDVCKAYSPIVIHGMQTTALTN